MCTTTETISSKTSKCPGPVAYPHNDATCTYCDSGTEIDNLRKAARYAYLTLGYYATPYNYDSKNIAYHPLTGKAASGIMFDGGSDAREAIEKMKMFLPSLHLW